MNKPQVIEALKAKGVVPDESLHVATLTKQLNDLSGTESSENASVETPTSVPPQKPDENKEGYVKVTDVQAMIAAALEKQKAEGNAPLKMKKVTEHTAHVWRFDGKWVVDFKDRNTDPYVKEKVHAYQKFNEQRREFEAWIELVFDDGLTKDLPLTTYVKNRVLVYCPIIKRHMIDRSYSIGEVEKKKEVNDKLQGTGVMVDQEVTISEEVFEVKTPSGVFKIPAYAIA